MAEWSKASDAAPWIDAAQSEAGEASSRYGRVDGSWRCDWGKWHREKMLFFLILTFL